MKVKIRFYNWFRGRNSWYFALLPEMNVCYGTLGDVKNGTVNIGWLCWFIKITFDNFYKYADSNNTNIEKKGGEK